MKTFNSISSRASELHKRAIVIDGHSDLLMPIADGYVRLGQQIDVPDPQKWEPPFPIAAESTLEGQWPLNGRYGCLGQYSLPQFLTGGLTAQVCAVFVRDEELINALHRSMQMVWWLRHEAEVNDAFELVTTAADLRRLKKEGRCGGILALEGIEPVGTDLKFLDIFHASGRPDGGYGAQPPQLLCGWHAILRQTGGLSEMGRRAIERMNEIQIVVDVAHTDQIGYWETLEISQSPVVLSHGSPRRFFPMKPEDSPLQCCARCVTRSGAIGSPGTERRCLRCLFPGSTGCRGRGARH